MWNTIGENSEGKEEHYLKPAGIDVVCMHMKQRLQARGKLVAHAGSVFAVVALMSVDKRDGVTSCDAADTDRDTSSCTQSNNTAVVTNSHTLQQLCQL